MSSVSLTFEPYKKEYKAACIAVLESNLPRYFIPEDVQDFEKFLTLLPGPYVVVISQGTIIGCGGWALGNKKDVGHLTWGMIHSAHHLKGYGHDLLMHRMGALREAGVSAIRLSTTQFVSAFYERVGFRVIDIASEAYGAGLDRVDMRIDL